MPFPAEESNETTLSDVPVSRYTPPFCLPLSLPSLPPPPCSLYLFVPLSPFSPPSPWVVVYPRGIHPRHLPLMGTAFQAKRILTHLLPSRFAEDGETMHLWHAAAAQEIQKYSQVRVKACMQVQGSKATAQYFSELRACKQVSICTLTREPLFRSCMQELQE